MASRSLDAARAKGVKVEERVMARADQYTKDAITAPAAKSGGVVGGVPGGLSATVSVMPHHPPRPAFRSIKARKLWNS